MADGETAKQAGKRESKTFSSSAWHLFFVQHRLEDNLSRPNSKTPRRRQFSCASFNHDRSHYSCLAFCRCVLPRGLVKQVVIHFLFISHRPTFVPASWSVPTTTHISTTASTGWTPKSVPPGSPSNPSIAKKRNIKTCRIDASSIGSRSCLFFLPASCCGRPRTNSTSLSTTLPLPANNTLTACTHHYRDEMQFSRHCLYPPPCVWPACDNPPVVSPNMAGSGALVTHSPSSCPSRPRPCFSFRFPPPLPALLPISG